MKYNTVSSVLNREMSSSTHGRITLKEVSFESVRIITWQYCFETVDRHRDYEENIAGNEEHLL